MTIQERAAHYNATYAKYPASHVHVVSEGRGAFEHDVLYGVWVLGQNYRSTSTLYGAYPPDLLSRYAALFPDRRRVLHACAGSLPPGPYTRLDIHPDRRPDVLGDVHVPPFADNTFDLIYIDPPYSEEDSLKYGTDMIVRPQVLRGLARVLQPGGFVVWLDTVLPIYQNAQWSVAGRIGVPEVNVPFDGPFQPVGFDGDVQLSLLIPGMVPVGMIPIVRSTNHRFRMVTIFERRAA